MLGSKPASTPSDPSLKLCSDDSTPNDDIPAYIRLISRLIYLNTTWPDITYITQQLSQFLSQPIKRSLVTIVSACTATNALGHSVTVLTWFLMSPPKPLHLEY
jgi:hypothetical protein